MRKHVGQGSKLKIVIVVSIKKKHRWKNWPWPTRNFATKTLPRWRTHARYWCFCFWWRIDFINRRTWPTIISLFDCVRWGWLALGGLGRIKECGTELFEKENKGQVSLTGSLLRLFFFHLMMYVFAWLCVCVCGWIEGWRQCCRSLPEPVGVQVATQDAANVLSKTQSIEDG